jgi:hypothetical protein
LRVSEHIPFVVCFANGVSLSVGIPYWFSERVDIGVRVCNKNVVNIPIAESFRVEFDYPVPFREHVRDRDAI